MNTEREEKQLIKNRAYQMNYYHTDSKKQVQRELCKKIYSSISAMRRHRRKNMHCRLLQLLHTFTSKTT